MYKLSLCFYIFTVFSFQDILLYKCLSCFRFS
nr:MAG TPA: hypothetical protein [Bacteriophage sp.]